MLALLVLGWVYFCVALTLLKTCFYLTVTTFGEGWLQPAGLGEVHWPGVESPGLGKQLRALEKVNEALCTCVAFSIARRQVHLLHRLG